MITAQKKQDVTVPLDSVRRRKKRKNKMLYPFVENYSGFGRNNNNIVIK